MKQDTKELIISRFYNEKGYEIGYIVRGELVRCEDCKKSSKCYRHTIIQSSTGSGEIHCPLEYCSEGERRELGWHDAKFCSNCGARMSKGGDTE